ncbi:hypothetical protein [Streptomyces sp. JHA26]|nr:hypothetical protein [Streptomyces sp. JHA26]
MARTTRRFRFRLAPVDGDAVVDLVSDGTVPVPRAGEGGTAGAAVSP